jgi:putative tricarboxylic transport membrane protein
LRFVGAGLRRANLLGGGVLGLLGVISLVEALRIRDDWQGARLMPAALAVVLIALGIAHLAPSMVAPADGSGAWPDAPGRRRVAVVFGLLALYVAGLPLLGFLPATALFLLILLRYLGAFSWATTLVLAGAIAIAAHVVFKHWLAMPLPPGAFGL